MNITEAEAIDASALRACEEPAEIIEFIEDRWDGEGGGVLDEMVHDHKLAEAADLNNDGIEAQITYLVERGEHPAELAAILAEALYDRY